MSGSGPDRKGAFAGVAFSPPRRDDVPAEASGWTSSDEDEADARTPAAANPRALSPRRNEKEKAFLATRAIRFVPPGSVTHVPPAVSARDAEATRRAMLRDAEAAGARTVGGKWMLVYQAAEQLETWTGRTAPVEVMAAAFDRAG